MARIAKKITTSQMSIKERWQRLNLAIAESGIGEHVKNSPILSHRLREIEDAFNENFPIAEKRTSESFLFFTRASIIREIIRDDLIQLGKWISNPRFIHEAHEMADRFLKYGPEALTDKYRRIDGYRGGKLIWDEDARIEIVMMTRGSGKTYLFTAVKAVQQVLKDPFSSWLVSSHKVEPQALEILDLIRQLMFNPNLALVYPELFSEDMSIYTARGSTITKKRINVIKFSPDEDFDVRSLRKAPSFLPTGLNVELTSTHVNGVFLDDIVVAKTSETDKVVEKTIKYFDSLAGYKEHGSKHPFMIFLTDTMWWKPSLLDHLIENRKVKAFIAPAVWKDRANKTVRLIPAFTDKYIGDLTEEFGQWAESQVYMEGRDRDVDFSLNINFNTERNVVRMSEREFDRLYSKTLHIQVCDPAFSKKNKKEGDDKSRFTILHALMDEDVTYLYDVYQTFGEEVLDIIDANANRAFEHDTDLFVQDGHGTQLGLVASTVRVIEKTLNRRILSFSHNNNAFTGSSDKILLANETLSSLFISKNIVIIDTPRYTDGAKAIVKQLKREDPGFDIVDCITYGELNVAKDKPRDAVVKSMKMKRIARHSRRMSTDATLLIDGAPVIPKSRVGLKKKKKRHGFK